MENINLDLFHPKKAELQKMADQYKDLKINWLEDKEGYKLVHEAQMTLRNARTWIQKTRLDYTRQFDEAKKQAMGLEKELLSIIEPLEENLKAQKEEIDTEKERIKEEERLKKAEALQKRVDALWKYDYIANNILEIAEMSEIDFNIKLELVKNLFLIEEEKRLEREKQEKLEKVKNEANSLILNAKTLEDLEDFKSFLQDNLLNFSDFETIFNQKKEMLEFDKKQADFQKQQEQLKQEQEKLENEKKEKERAEREEGISGLRRELIQAWNLEELKKVFNNFSSLDKETLEYDFKTLSNKIIQDQKSKERAEVEAKEKAEKEKLKLEKQKKYQEFLKENWISQEAIENGEITFIKNEDLKTMTFYKKINTFNY